MLTQAPLRLEVMQMRRYIGVTKTEDDRYEAKIFRDGEESSIGVYNTDVEAAYVYDRTAEASHGDFAVLNFPEIVAEPENA